MRSVKLEVQGKALSPVRTAPVAVLCPFMGSPGFAGMLSESKN